jgi:hypothetical protein
LGSCECEHTRRWQARQTKLNEAIVAAQAAPAAGKDDAYRDLLAAFGKLDSAGQEAIVQYLKTQV